VPDPPSGARRRCGTRLREPKIRGRKGTEMASVEQTNPVQIDPDELANSVVDEGASLAVRRLFAIAGRDPFDEVEWEIRAAFNPPVWFNVGFEEKPQCSACFILSIEDSMDAILDWIRREGIIFRGGSGSGVNLSRLRSSKEQLSKGGHASGPVSFMRGADASAVTIKSGGKTRRAAKMVVLD